MNTIKNIGNWIWKNKAFILLGLVIALICVNLERCGSLADRNTRDKYERKISEQNMRASKDQLKYVKNKAGEKEAVISAFVTRINELEQLNKDIYQEVKKEFGEVRGLIKGTVSVDTGPILMSNELVKRDSTTYGLLFEKTQIDTGFVWDLKGESRFKFENNTIYPGITSLTTNKLKLDIVLGFKENKDNYEVFARSPNSKVTFTDLHGVLLIPKKSDITCPPIKAKRWGLGFNVGGAVGYDAIHNNFAAGPMISFGVQYNFLQW